MDVVIFGLHGLGSLAWYVLTHDSDYRVVGFTVDRAFRKTDRFHDLPVVDFEDLEQHFPPDRVLLLTAIGWKEMNRMRERKYREGKARGYRFATYVSSRALTWPDLQVGENTLIYDGAAVQPFASIGNNCVVRSGSLVSHHSVLGDHCFVAAHAVIAGRVRIGSHCVIGLNATVRDDISVAPGCFIGAGAALMASTEADGVYVGVPAKRRGDSSSI